MKVLIAADIFHPQTGGPATYAAILANEFVKQDIPVEIISLNSRADASIVNCKVHKTTAVGWLSRYIQFFILIFKNSRRFDLIYAMGPVNAGLPALLAAKLRKKKLVVKVVGDYAWEQGTQRYRVKDNVDVFQSGSHYTGAVQTIKFVQKFVIKRSAAIIVPSNYLNKMVVGWGAKDVKVKTIYNAVEVPVTQSASKDIGEKWVVFAGRLVPWKGLNMLIDAMVEVKKSFVKAKLKIVGDGPEFNKLKVKVDLAGLGEVVEFLGKKTRLEAFKYIKAGDVFVLNSEYEGLSHVLLESLLLGTVCIASNKGGNAEVLPADNLFTYNNKEEIVNKILQAFNGATPFSFNADKFSLNNMITSTKEILENLCQN